MQHFHYTAHRRPLVRAALLLAVLLTALFASSALAQAPSTFADRWLRVQHSAYFGQIPLLTGNVASVTYMAGEEGKETEIRTWTFNERGWPSSTETAFNPGPNAFEYTSTWTYGSDGQLNRVEIGGRSSFVWFLSWDDASLEINGDPFHWEYAYDAEADVLTQLETFPQGQIRRVYQFNADGSYEFTNYSKDEEGEWQPSASATVSAENIMLVAGGATFKNTTTVTERDEAGNPVSAERVTTGEREAVTPLYWQIEYR